MVEAKPYHMFLQLKHPKLNIFKFSRSFVGECYRLTNELPIEERYNLVSQIRRAALSVYLNIAEGASRNRIYKKEKKEQLGFLMIKCFKILCGLIN